ncbi:hypothetical protein jhhlp_006986 [Lomentospora prolificans]|uniref:CENP-V/GFA domain-containing protein n=1 Tax=Lomentospora prolificans TaxID=41688 RepID=A0A2N3N1E0_9PEZI|nr:hypothetical protein jhhlp_006986 [Lomentospora prolificans]
MYKLLQRQIPNAWRRAARIHFCSVELFYSSMAFQATLRRLSLRVPSKMKALVYSKVGKVELQDRPAPKIASPTDAIVKLKYSTICGTDLHIRKGEVATCAPGRVLGHEGVGIVEQAGEMVSRFKIGDEVIISCISSCSSCEYCRRGMPSHCTTGGWILGNKIDGTQAEYVRIPHADSSLYNVPKGVADTASLVSVSDTFPTAYECGTLNGKVQPGSTVAVVGVGPIGLAVMATANFYSPSKVIMIDMDENRLKVASEMGATSTIRSGPGTDVVKEVLAQTDGKGCDVVIEAVGIPATFELCQRILAPGGVLANIGVHGTKVDLFLNELWEKNISITTRLVDAVTTPTLIKMVEARKLQPDRLLTHKFKFSEIEKAYETFGNAAKNNALKSDPHIQERLAFADHCFLHIKLGTMSDEVQPDADWTAQPPYQSASHRSDYVPRHRGSCHCGRIQYSLAREEPLASKYCHCRDCQTLHAAPFQWAAIFHKADMVFDNGTEGLAFYRSATRKLGHDLPCKVSCEYCRTPIMDEGRNMVLLFPTLIRFGNEEDRRRFRPQCHIFYSQRVVDIPDGTVKWTGLDGKSEKMDVA